MTKIISTAPLSFLKPHCDSGVTHLAIVDVSLRSINLARIFPGMPNKEIPLLLEQMDFFFLIFVDGHYVGILPLLGPHSLFHTSRMQRWNVLMQRKPLSLKISAGMLSGPGVLLFLRVLIATSMMYRFNSLAISAILHYGLAVPWLTSRSVLMFHVAILNGMFLVFNRTMEWPDRCGFLSRHSDKWALFWQPFPGLSPIGVSSAVPK